jgi:integrase
VWGTRPGASDEGGLDSIAPADCTARRELHGAKWEEFDLASGWWTIPASRSKNKLSHRAPLSPHALRIVKGIHELTGKSEWVFPSPWKKCPHVHHAQKAFERLVERSGVKFRGHDLRRTAASASSQAL